MKQKTFRSPHWPNRPITVRVTPEFITFSFSEEDDREFYWIVTDEWVNDVTNRIERGDNWHKRMEGKVWFTSSIRKFINETLNLKDSGEPLKYDKWTESDERMKQRAKENGGFLSLSDIIEVMGEEEFKNGGQNE